MLAQHGNVHQTLVSVSANAPVAEEGGSILRLIPPVVMGESVLRTTQRCRRYVRLIDLTRHVWFHVFQENSMKPLERLTQMKRFALLLMAVALVASVISGWAQTSPRSDGEGASQSAKAARGATPYAELKNQAAPELIVDAP